MFGLVSGVALVEFAQPYEYEALYLFVLRYPVKGQLVMIARIQHTNTVQVRMYLLNMGFQLHGKHSPSTKSMYMCM